MRVNLIQISQDLEEQIVEIARVSSSRKDKREEPAKLINYLIKNKHWSPFEHAFLTFEIVTSRAIGTQLLRHRSFTFQEFSQRYAFVENIEPVEFRLQASNNRQSSTEYVGTVTPDKVNPIADDTLLALIRAMQGNNVNTLTIKAGYILEYLRRFYKQLLDAGVAHECARMVLPMCTQTTIYMSGTLRSWIHFLEIRDDSHAQKEVQLIAKSIKEILIKECPIICEALQWNYAPTCT